MAKRDYKGRNTGNPYPRISDPKRRYVHRAVMEKKLGRPLKPGEVCHHKDGDKTNFDPDNLGLFASQSEHATYEHLRRKVDAGLVPLFKLELLERD